MHMHEPAIYCSDIRVEYVKGQDGQCVECVRIQMRCASADHMQPQSLERVGRDIWKRNITTVAGVVHGTNMGERNRVDTVEKGNIHRIMGPISQDNSGHSDGPHRTSVSPYSLSDPMPDYNVHRDSAVGLDPNVENMADFSIAAQLNGPERVREKNRIQNYELEKDNHG